MKMGEDLQANILDMDREQMIANRAKMIAKVVNHTTYSILSSMKNKTLSQPKYTITLKLFYKFLSDIAVETPEFLKTVSWDEFYMLQLETVIKSFQTIIDQHFKDEFKITPDHEQIPFEVAVERI